MTGRTEWESKKLSGEFMAWNTVERAIKTEIDTKTEWKGVGKTWLVYIKDINRNIPATWSWVCGDCPGGILASCRLVIWCPGGTSMVGGLNWILSISVHFTIVGSAAVYSNFQLVLLHWTDHTDTNVFMFVYQGLRGLLKSVKTCQI